MYRIYSGILIQSILKQSQADNRKLFALRSDKYYLAANWVDYCFLPHSTLNLIALLQLPRIYEQIHIDE